MVAYRQLHKWRRRIIQKNLNKCPCQPNLSPKRNNYILIKKYIYFNKKILQLLKKVQVRQLVVKKEENN